MASSTAPLQPHAWSSSLPQWFGLNHSIQWKLSLPTLHSWAQPWEIAELIGVQVMPRQPSNIADTAEHMPKHPHDMDIIPTAQPLFYTNIH